MVSAFAILFLIRFVLQIRAVLTNSVIKMQHRNQDSKYTKYTYFQQVSKRLLYFAVRLKLCYVAPFYRENYVLVHV